MLGIDQEVPSPLTYAVHPWSAHLFLFFLIIESLNDIFSFNYDTFLEIHVIKLNEIR